MRLVGRDTGEVRLPLVPLEQPLVEKLRKVLTDYGVRLA
jgi:dihydrodipicolinate synthase/N-acetylneuraminate lyase